MELKNEIKFRFSRNSPRKSSEFIKACLTELQCVTESVHDQLHEIKTYILTFRTVLVESMLEQFHSISDVIHEQCETLTHTCSESKKSGLPMSNLEIQHFCKELEDFVMETGMHVYDHVTAQCDQLTEFLLIKKQEIMKFGETEFKVITDFIHENGNTSVQILQNEVKHVISAVLGKYETVSDFLTKECKDVESLAYDNLQQCCKHIQTECLLLQRL